MYTVSVSDKYEDEEFFNQLFFNFQNKEDAIKFVEYLLKISNYSIEIISHIKGE